MRIFAPQWKQLKQVYPKDKIKILFLENISDVAVKSFKQNGYVQTEKITRALTKRK
jgi:D-3-phosphoglycerate dehydrogenase